MNRKMTFTELMDAISEYGSTKMMAAAEIDKAKRADLHDKSFEQYKKILDAVAAAYFTAA